MQEIGCNFETLQFDFKITRDQTKGSTTSYLGAVHLRRASPVNR